MHQHKEAQAFLKTVCQQVRWKQAHETITRDLANHIEDQTEANIRSGMDQKEATSRAIKEMGDPVEIGLHMDASYRPQVEWTIVIPLLILVVLGAILQLMLYGSIAHYEVYEGESYTKLGLSIGISGLLAVFAYNINLYKLYKLSWIGYAIICISLVWRSTRDVVGLGYQGDANWQYISLFCPVFLSGILYSLRGKEIWRLIVGNAICAVPFLYALLWSGESFSSLLPCLVACLTVLVYFLASGQLAGKWRLILLVSLLTWCVALLLLTFNWQRMSINPFRYKQLATAVQGLMKDNYEGSCVREILEYARLFGRGGLTPRTTEMFLKGESIGGLEWGVMVNYFITYLIYRFGWVAGLFIVAMLSAVIIFGYSRCFRLGSMLGRLFCISILSVYSVQIVVYLLGCLGFTRFGVPFPLPFLSVGYRSQIINMVLMGILLNLFRTDGLFSDRQIQKKTTLPI